MKRTILTLGFILACLTVASAAPQKAVLDFDGDNKTDYAVVRPVSGTSNWYVQQSTAGFKAQPWGISSDTFVPADYDGDGKWDIAVWRGGTPANFYILQSTNGALRVVPFGTTGDDARSTQDFDGDGKADPAVVRSSGGSKVWYIQRSLLGFTSVPFGDPQDVSTRGDFDGDGKADVAVYRTNTGTPANTFYVLRSSDGGLQAQTFGDFTMDYVMPADFDGDGKTDYTVWRGGAASGNGTWYWLNSSNGSFHALPFGGTVVTTSDVPVVGDYDGDGKSDQAVWRRNSGTFYVNRSTLGFLGFQFGALGDTPPAASLQAR